MKFAKIFAFTLAAAALAACSNDDDKLSYNTNPDAVVCMAQSEYTFKEDRGIVKVPVAVTGERNGIVTAAFSVDVCGTNPAVEDAHYYVTSTTLNILPEDSIGYLEIKLIDDFEINENRTFQITIDSAEGAKVGDPNTAIFTIKDNDQDPYDKLCGKWYFECTDDGEASVNEVTISQPDELNEYGEPNSAYGHSLYFMNLVSSNGFVSEVPVKASYTCDENTLLGELTIKYGQTLPEIDLSDYGYGIGKGYLGFFIGSSSFDIEGTTTITWNEEMTELYVIQVPADLDLEDGADFAYMVETSAGWLYLGHVGNVKTFTRDKP